MSQFAPFKKWRHILSAITQISGIIELFFKEPGKICLLFAGGLLVNPLCGEPILGALGDSYKLAMATALWWAIMKYQRSILAKHMDVDVEELKIDSFCRQAITVIACNSVKCKSNGIKGKICSLR